MDKPVVSVVTGTYNRFDSLLRFVASTRDAIPRGLPYEVVIVDGGSTDGSLEWLRNQPDVRMIEHGELRGAMKAFCDGARAAIGDYVILANDDIAFKPYGILAAVSHLERTPTCAGVAFADNRVSLIRGDGTDFHAEVISAVDPNGRPISVVYAQVGMFRRQLGNDVGWWGDTDPIMSRARTYGGDSYLSARLWEMGFTIDAVPQAQVQDFILDDPLRHKNADIGPQDSAAYYERYRVLQLPAIRMNYPIKDRLRILSLPIYEPNYPGVMNRESGLTEALGNYGLSIEIDYINTKTDILEVIKAWQPDLLMTQIQGPSRLTPYVLASARNLCPGMTIVNWNGDAHESGLISPDVLDTLRHVDLQTTINAKVLPVYDAEGIRAAYWQIGFKDPCKPVPQMPAHEVLFMGNCYDDRRDAMVGMLSGLRRQNDARKINVGIYGNCRNANGNTHYDFTAQRALYERCKMTIGDTYPNTIAFVSNRLFQALAAGAFILQQVSQDLDILTGLRDGVHYVSWTNLDDLKNKIFYWLEHDSERQKIAAQGCEYVRANFSYDAQATKLFRDILPILEKAI